MQDAAKALLPARKISRKRTFKPAQWTQVMLRPAQKSAKRRKRHLQTRRIWRHGEQSMPQAHKEELTFAAGAAADHLRTAGTRTKR
ncbi:MAG: hypothetical protein P1U91_01960 [Pseudophaeobacter sp. bin_em_oilr2.035]|uniref:Uncharacterized protein n=1 Tax=Phaeobacter gallaeciensis TaxID=60890 RepID=A0ABD4XF41_9RHOB|nr:MULTISPECIES: hypothetical protein [Phaeobacter]MDF1770699.1 hypothetical protein [Pseudophaeobacter sp. bin_em_oilr2.035]MDE4146702.1 hypothetical protein [Phaeobacter gallaeciensis]MDE4159375.1 hypothetical protein [Phaeobacter gallaeciensis]MDE4163510.1 hypothetical protein [Phaeobacter gallaeciensis]MDE4167784.1 hypothetical protein [Phaeobacter gallaeciensis]